MADSWFHWGEGKTLMKIETMADILEVLRMPYDRYVDTVAPYAKQLHVEHNQNALTATAMLGFDNICRNQCLYCGMRAGNTALERYRMDRDDVLSAAAEAAGVGFQRIFLISGEDPKYGFNNLIYVVENLKKMGFFISLACGELSKEQYHALSSAGGDEYVLKFEMAQEQVFHRMKPSTNLKKRIQGMEWVKKSGMRLASGNIVDYPGQTDEQRAEDILLMKRLEISWAPVIPYLPVKGTPLAKEGGRGSLEKNLKEISILRIMMPDLHITAQQPGENLANGLADPAGNLNALNAGADMLFADILPTALVKNFSVIDNRITLGLAHIKDMAERAGMILTF